MCVTWAGGLTKFVTFGESGVIFRGDKGMDCFASLAMTVQEKGPGAMDDAMDDASLG